MKTGKLLILILVSAGILSGCSPEKKDAPLIVGIAPYQDLAMIVNAKNLDLEHKYGTKLDLITMNWENILPAVSSSGKTIDVGFGSLIEFLTKEGNINKGTSDSLVFIYPAYVFKGGGFITFDKNEPSLTKQNLNNKLLVSQFLAKRIGAQKNSVYEMMLFRLANLNHVDFKKLNITNTSLNDGILATENSSLDIASAGLTQLTQTQKENGKILLTMEDMGFADITGFICKQSTLRKRGTDIKNLISMWFDCVQYVTKDIDQNSKISLAYLDQKAATKYTLEQYKKALSQEYFPTSITEAEKELIQPNGKFNATGIATDVASYLTSNKIIPENPSIPKFIKVN